MLAGLAVFVFLLAVLLLRYYLKGGNVGEEEGLETDGMADRCERAIKRIEAGSWSLEQPAGGSANPLGCPMLGPGREQSRRGHPQPHADRPSNWVGRWGPAGAQSLVLEGKLGTYPRPPWIVKPCGDRPRHGNFRGINLQTPTTARTWRASANEQHVQPGACSH
jgi:hypothetical protein